MVLLRNSMYKNVEDSNWMVQQQKALYLKQVSCAQKCMSTYMHVCHWAVMHSACQSWRYIYILEINLLICIKYSCEEVKDMICYKGLLSIKLLQSVSSWLVFRCIDRGLMFSHQPQNLSLAIMILFVDNVILWDVSVR